MADLDIAQTTTTDLKGTVPDVTVAAQVPDAQSEQTKETFWDYPDAAANLGYYKTIPELKSALHVLVLRVCGIGWTADATVTAILESLTGWGEDSFQSICHNLLIQKKVFGDAFAEIMRDGTGLINLKPLYPGDMRVVVNQNGLVKRYEQRSRTPNAAPKNFTPDKILHLVNNRVANEIHGISIVEVLKTIIDAKNEALSDERKIRHRELALGVLELDSDKPAKVQAAIKQYQNAVKNGEVLVTLKGVSELKDNPNTPRDRLQWLQYLDNLFYQVVGTPKVLVTSEGFTEAGGKAGLLAFEPTEIAEKLDLEADLWNQVAIRVKFTRTPSIANNVQSDEAKNTGQTNIQPNETQVRPKRTE